MVYISSENTENYVCYEAKKTKTILPGSLHPARCRWQQPSGQLLIFDYKSNWLTCHRKSGSTDECVISPHSNNGLNKCFTPKDSGCIWESTTGFSQAEKCWLTEHVAAAACCSLPTSHTQRLAACLFKWHCCLKWWGLLILLSHAFSVCGPLFRHF